MQKIVIGLVMIVGAVTFAVFTENTRNEIMGVLVLVGGLLFGVYFTIQGIFDISMRAGLIVRALFGVALTAIVLLLFGNDLSADKLGLAALGVVIVIWAMLDWRDLAASDREVDAILNASPSTVPNLLDEGASLERLCQALEQEGFDTKAAIGQVASHFQEESNEHGGLSDIKRAQLDALKNTSPWLQNRDPEYLLRSANFPQLVLYASNNAMGRVDNGPLVSGVMFLTPAHLVFIEIPADTIAKRLGQMALDAAVSKMTLGLSEYASVAHKMASNFVDSHPAADLLQGLGRENSVAIYLSDIQSLHMVDDGLRLVTKDKSFTFTISYPKNYAGDRKDLEALERFLWALNIPEAAMLHGRVLAIS